MDLENRDEDWFVTSFERLKQTVHHQPKKMITALPKDQDLVKLCEELKKWKRRYEKTTNFLTTGGNDFIAAFREYESDYEKIIFIGLRESYKKSGKMLLAAMLPEDDALNADFQTSQMKYALAKTLYDFGYCSDYYDEEDQASWGLDSEGFVIAGLQQWAELEEICGFDIGGVIRRYYTLRPILAPEHVSDDVHDPWRARWINQISEVRSTFVCGHFRATIALLRSVVEAVLNIHYEAKGKDLNEKINAVARELPAGANKAALHRLRKLANEVLHLSIVGSEERLWKQPDNEEELEKQILRMIKHVSDLIEGAPSQQ